MRGKLANAAVGCSLIALFVASGCNSGGVSTPSPNPTAVPTQTGTASPTSTPAPTATPTPTPVPTPFPTGSGVASLCTGTATSSVPGTYTTILELGNFTSAFQATSGSWIVQSYAAANATPTPTPAPSTTPQPTPTPAQYYVWTGTYAVGAFNITSPATSVSATTGCLVLIATVGGSSPNLAGVGTPVFATNTSSTFISTGLVSVFSVPGLATNNGPFNGTLQLDNSTAGTLSITAFQNIMVQSASQRDAINQIRKRVGM